MDRMRVLIVDDNPAEADALCQYFLDRVSYAEWTACTTSAAARARLSPFEVVVTDLLFRCCTPEEVLANLMGMPSRPRILILTALREDDPILKAVPRGIRVLHAPATAEQILQAAYREALIYRGQEHAAHAGVGD